MKKTTEKKNHDVVVIRAIKFDDGNINFDMAVNDVTIYGCRWVVTDKSEFVGFPNKKGKDGKYYNNVYVALSDEDEKTIKSMIDRLLACE